MANLTGKKFGGRKKGTPNKQTKEIREAYQFLIENNLENLENWLNRVAETNPEKAIGILLKVTDYVVPKLDKVEVPEESIDEYENMTEEELNEEIKAMYNDLMQK